MCVEVGPEIAIYNPDDSFWVNALGQKGAENIGLFDPATSSFGYIECGPDGFVPIVLALGEHQLVAASALAFGFGILLQDRKRLAAICAALWLASILHMLISDYSGWTQAMAAAGTDADRIKDAVHFYLTNIYQMILFILLMAFAVPAAVGYVLRGFFDAAKTHHN